MKNTYAKGMENVKLTLQTDYAKYGNSSGMQIDTLSMAVCGSDYEDVYENSLEWLDQYTEYALKEYNYEADFLKGLSAKDARRYIDNAEEYKEALSAFTDDLRDKALSRELDEKHPLAIALSDAEMRAGDDLRHEWLYGDYREAGLLKNASRKYAVDFHYDEKTDALSLDIEEGELADMIEYQGVKKSKKAVGEYLADMIEAAAYSYREKNKARSEENRKNYETRNRIKAERKAEEEAERVAKLKKII